MAGGGTIMHEDEERAREIARWRNAPRRRPADVPRPGPGQESVWDYPRPPRVEPDGRRVQVIWADRVLADTTAALRVLETAGAPTFYLPSEDVDTRLLEPASRRSLCEWKGQARYWSARVGERFAAEIAWSYPDPLPEYAQLAGRFCFYAGRVDACWVGGERVTPQPGDFYGGWITREVLGPFKGEPGTEGW
jgi:uncharacterized protein (DUF427 family)